MTNSKQKGKRGELEVVHVLKEHGFAARRGQQFKGTNDSPDIIHSLPIGQNLEVKRVEKLNVQKALDQSMSDKAPEDIAVVVHRSNKTEWKVTLYLDDYLDIMKMIDVNII